MKKSIKINLIVLMIFIIVVITPLDCFTTEIVEQDTAIENSVNANETEDNNRIDELQKEKEQIQSDIKESQRQVEVVKTELSDLLVQIEEMTIEIDEKNKEIDLLAIENANLTYYINNVQNDLDKISADYKVKKETLDNRLVASYQRGKTSYLDVLLNSNGLISFISNYYLLSEIINSDNKLLQDVSKAKKYMEELETSLKEKKASLEENTLKIMKTKVYLQNMESLKQVNVIKLSKEEEELYKQIEEYNNSIQEVEREIRRLNLENVGTEYIGGKMAWPVPGYTRITSPFGMRTHPITGVYKLHSGTDIGAPYGALFIAANDGVVIKAEYNGAYGNMVIIDHGGGINTLYAHGSEILVSVGEYVEQGTPILKVGSTGYSTGPHAHFEVRVNGDFRDPMDYLLPSNTNDNEENEVEEVTLNN